ncbi:MAG: hypothetical protein AAF990_11305 [Bacteroidota bacterium]
MKYQICIVLACLLVGCASPMKLLEKGNYEKAFDISAKRLKKGKIKSEHLAALEWGFAELNQRDLRKIADLRQSGQATIWPGIFRTASTLAERQAKIRPVLNRLEEEGFSPGIKLYPIEPVLEEARDKSALLFYARAQEQIPAARSGDRFAAREAYDLLRRCQEYRPGFRDAGQLEPEMYELGTTNIQIVAMPGMLDAWDADWIYARLFQDQLFPVREGWQLWHLNQLREGEADMFFEIVVDQAVVGPNQETSESCTNQKEIVVDYEIREEWSEEDSAYVEVKYEILETVSFTVVTYEQSKNAHVGFQLRLVDARSGYELRKQRLDGRNCWTNSFTEAWGDRRAESLSCCASLGGPENYPSNEWVMTRAVDQAGRRFGRALRKMQRSDALANR